MTTSNTQLVADCADVIVLWDLDRTLVDLCIDIASVHGWKRALERQFHPLGWTAGWSPILPSLQAALTSVGASVDMWATVYADLDQWEMNALTGVTVHEPTLSAACTLQRAGITQAIITNNGPTACQAGLEALHAHAETLGWRPPLFSAVAARGPNVRAKPDIALLVHAITLTGRPFRRVLVVGDAPSDRAAAATLDEQTAWETAFCLVVNGELQVDPALERRLQAWGLPALASTILGRADSV